MLVTDSSGARARAGREIAAGGIVAFRTDTFYGLGVDPFNRHALRALKSLKGREADKPILVIISDEVETERFVADETSLFDAVRKHFWPGALTLVARARAEVPDELTAGSGTIGVRLPDDKDVRDFVRVCGGALTATSANLAGAPPARTAVDVRRAFPTGLALIVDGGEARRENPSTVLDVTESPARLIREGVVTRRELQQTLPLIGAE